MFLEQKYTPASIFPRNFAGVKFYILLLSITCLSLTCSSQNTGDWEEVVRQWADAENIESAALENVFESLSELSEQPINLNQADREELEQLPFLTAQQVEDILKIRSPVWYYPQLQ